MTSYEKKIALKEAGYREKYAMENGKETCYYNGNHRMIKFEYSNDDPYQDANGATFDVTEGRWRA